MYNCSYTYNICIFLLTIYLPLSLSSTHTSPLGIMTHCVYSSSLSVCWPTIIHSHQLVISMIPIIIYSHTFSTEHTLNCTEHILNCTEHILNCTEHTTAYNLTVTEHRISLSARVHDINLYFIKYIL